MEQALRVTADDTSECVADADGAAGAIFSCTDIFRNRYPNDAVCDSDVSTRTIFPTADTRTGIHAIGFNPPPFDGDITAIRAFSTSDSRTIYRRSSN